MTVFMAKPDPVSRKVWPLVFLRDYLRDVSEFVRRARTSGFVGISAIVEHDMLSVVRVSHRYVTGSPRLPHRECNELPAWILVANGIEIGMCRKLFSADCARGNSIAWRARIIDLGVPRLLRV